MSTHQHSSIGNVSRSDTCHVVDIHENEEVDYGYVSAEEEGEDEDSEDEEDEEDESGGIQDLGPEDGEDFDMEEMYYNAKGYAPL